MKVTMVLEEKNGNLSRKEMKKKHNFHFLTL